MPPTSIPFTICQQETRVIECRDTCTFDVDTVRLEDKDVYEGPIQLPAPGKHQPSSPARSCTVRLTVRRMRDSPGDAPGPSRHWEVAGTCPELTALQAGRLQAAASGRELDPQDRDARVAEARGYIAALVGFCTQLRTYL